MFYNTFHLLLNTLAEVSIPTLCLDSEPYTHTITLKSRFRPCTSEPSFTATSIRTVVKPSTVEHSLFTFSLLLGCSSWDLVTVCSTKIGGKCPPTVEYIQMLLSFNWMWYFFANSCWSSQERYNDRLLLAMLEPSGLLSCFLLQTRLRLYCTWSYPPQVHNWLVLYIYKPALANGLSKSGASVLVEHNLL